MTSELREQTVRALDAWFEDHVKALATVFERSVSDPMAQSRFIAGLQQGAKVHAAAVAAVSDMEAS